MDKSLKDDIKQEFKYIFHSQKNRKNIAIVGNFKSIDYTFTHPITHYGTVINNAFFSVMVCLLSNGIMLPPLILTTLGDLNTGFETSVSNTENTSFVVSPFHCWLKLVWEKRHRLNVQSLLVTSTDLPSGIDKLLKKYNTELMILPDIIKADIEPLNEVWCNQFICEILKRCDKWVEEFSVMLSLEICSKIIYSAWKKCGVGASFDKLFIADEDKEVFTVLEDEFMLQKQWIKKTCTSQDSKIKICVFEIFRCLSCLNLLLIEDCGKHSLREVSPHENNVYPYRKLVAIGYGMYFTCFMVNGDGTLHCEICSKQFITCYLAAHHILNHLQQKWCRFCFSQLFIGQEHTCHPSKNERSVFAQEGILASALTCEDPYVKSNHLSNEEIPPEDLPSNTANLVSTQHKNAGVSNGLEGTPLIEIQSFENAENLSLNEDIPPENLPSNTANLVSTQHKDAYAENVSNGSEGTPLMEKQSFENTENLSLNEEIPPEDLPSNTANLASIKHKGLSSLEMSENNAVGENSQNDDDYTCLNYATKENHSLENLASMLKKARLDSMEYFQMLDSLAENEDYFLEEIEVDKCDSIPDLFHIPTISMKETAVVTKQGFPQDHDDDRIVVSDDNRFYKTLRIPGSLSFNVIPNEVPSIESVSSKEESVSSKEESVSSKEDSVSSKEENVSSKEESVSSKEDSISSKEDSISSKEDSVSSKEDSVSSKEESVGNHKGNTQLSQTLKGVSYENNESNVKYILCHLCNKELETSAAIAAHVCKDIHYPRDLEELFSFSGHKTPPKSINETGILCNFCGTELLNDAEVLQHVCQENVEVYEDYFNLIESLSRM